MSRRGGKTTAPKRIYSFWQQGRAQAPEVVKLCLSLWEELNPEYEMIVFDGEMATKALGEIGHLSHSLPVQALSDVLRAKLLMDGGVWVDATVLPKARLVSWLPRHLGGSRFFAFERTDDRPIASWFLAAEPGNYLVSRWMEEARRFWQSPRVLANYNGRLIPDDPVGEVMPGRADRTGEYPYFWSHYLFRFLLETDASFATDWRRCRKLPAGPAHLLQELYAGGSSMSIKQARKAARQSPVQKLNWRSDYPLTDLAALPRP